MTTDITERAQREKFEAWAHSQKLSLAYGDCGYAFSSTEMAWRAWKASSAELVEALEKAQTKAIEQGRTACELFDEVTALRQRIAELESRTVKLPEVRITIAEAKLRNLTHQQHDAYNAGASRAVAKISQELTVQGIKVEAE
ncbi:hypothetical protein [Raoultella planticola]|uniref:hypothetical protein n=1 Tax=Raoultella planticola TaxID=575 RepID=UPI00045979BC|nr:hypothetical protein DF41_18065 [Raoultella planticola]